MYIVHQPHIVAHPNVSRAYISTIYFLGGCALLFEAISRVVFHFDSIIAMIVITLLSAMGGIVMVSSSGARNAVNRQKLLGIFVCLLLAGISASIGVAILTSSFGRLTMHQAHEFQVLYYYLRLSLVLIAGIIVLTLASHDNQYPMISVIPKVSIGSAVIISCCVGFIFEHVSSGFMAAYYIQIVCAVLIGLGTVAGIIMGIVNNRSEDKSRFVVSCV